MKLIRLRPSPSPILCLVILSLACVSSARASSPVLDAPDEAQARSTVSTLRASATDFADFQKAALAAWNSRCKDSSADTCAIEECDVAPVGSCRPNRALLFRGQSNADSLPAASDLLKSFWSGSRYASTSSASGLLAQLGADFQLLRPAYFSPDEQVPVILQRKADGRSPEDRWLYAPNDGDGAIVPAHPTEADVIHALKPRTPDAPQLSLSQLVFLYHALASYPLYQDPSLGTRTIDPLVSFSSNPGVAIGFAGKHGRLLIASVPRSEIQRECGEKLSAPGSVWDPTGCPDDGMYQEEREFDAVLYLSPAYAWKSYLLP